MIKKGNRSHAGFQEFNINYHYVDNIVILEKKLSISYSSLMFYRKSPVQFVLQTNDNYN